MDIDILIDKIVREVVKRVESFSTKAMLVGKGEYIKRELEKSDICLMHCESYSDGMSIDEYDFIIIQEMSNFELISSALLVPGTQVSKLIFKCRLTGKKVYVEKDSIEYRKYELTMDAGLKAQLEHYEERLKSYGVKILKADEIIREINVGRRESKELQNEEGLNSTNQKDECQPQIPYILDKKLITEQDLRKLVQQGCRIIQISKGSIVTPLAADYMKTNNISLFKE